MGLLAGGVSQALGIPPRRVIGATCLTPGVYDSKKRDKTRQVIEARMSKENKQ
jgi:hypothetical protein